MIIPPGVVHAYQNVDDMPGLLLNFPNQLYRGPQRQEPVDEIRHEEDPFSPFKVDFMIRKTRQFPTNVSAGNAGNTQDDGHGVFFGMPKK